MMKFSTAFNPGKIIPTEPGNDEVETFKYEYNEERNRFERVKTGSYSMTKFVQMSAGSCDINAIMERALNGDVSVLNVRQGQYIDSTMFPKDLRGVNDLSNKSRVNFEALPDDIRALWNNDYDLFFNAVLDNTVSSTIENYVKSKVKVDDKEVKTDE